MRLLTLLSLLLLLACLGWSALRVNDAWRASESELIELEGRSILTRDLLRSLVPASRDQIKALRAQTETLAEQAGRRRTSLLDGRFATPPPGLGELLNGPTGEILAEGSSTRERMLQLAAQHPPLELGLASILHAMKAHESLRLEEFSFRDRGVTRELPHARGLSAVECELVLLGDLEGLLLALDQLVPGRGEPLLVVEHASLRRLDPPLWESLPQTHTQPPIRLWVHLSLVFGGGTP